MAKRMMQIKREEGVNRRSAWWTGVTVIMGVMLCNVTEVTAECVTAPQWTEQVVRDSAGVSISTDAEIKGADALALVSRFNATPPATDLRSDHILVLKARDLKTGLWMRDLLVGFFFAGCKVASGKASPEQVDYLLDRAGEGAMLGGQHGNDFDG